MTEALKDIPEGEKKEIDCQSCRWTRVVKKINGKLIVEDTSSCLVNRRKCVVTEVEESNRH